MELCEIQYIDGQYKEVSRDRINPPEFTHLEKNWMPILDMPFHFVRWCNPLEIIKVNPNNKSKQNQLDMSRRILDYLKDNYKILNTNERDHSKRI